MKTTILRVAIVSMVSLWSIVYASDSNTYIQSYRDYKVLERIQERVEMTKEGFEEEELIYQLGLISKYEVLLQDDPQATYLLSESKQYLLEAIQLLEMEKTQILDQIQVQETQETSIPESAGSIEEKQPIVDNPSTISSIPKNIRTEKIVVDDTVQQDTTQELQDDNEGIDSEAGSISTIDANESFFQIAGPLDEGIENVSPEQVTPNADVQFAIRELYEEYANTIQGEVSPLCVVYYDQIDQIAKRNDFPTSLIIAMWYREHSCILSNPDNGRGNFQITSHYYEPGEIVRDEFATQVQNYIDFSRAKWKYYDAIQTFGPDPVSLSYDTMDITSIRKHAILYNGVYPDVTLESSWYSNENFTQFRDGRDGVIATVLKVIQWEVENR